MAIVPVLFTLGLLAIPRISGTVPPLLGTFSAAAVALWYFKAPADDLITAWNDNFWTLIKVLAIIGGGVLLSGVMDRTGAQRKLANWLSAGGPTIAAALLMAHGVVPFLETVTGFGVSVLIGLPLLLSLGFTPYRAALLTLLGLMIGPWGSMGPGTLVAAEVAGASLTDMGLVSGLMNLIPFVVSGVAVSIVAGNGLTDQKLSWGQRFAWAGVGAGSGLLLWALTMIANLLLGTPVAGAVSTLMMSVLWLLYIRRGRLTPGPGRSLIPYLILMIGTITGQLIYRAYDLGVLGEVLASPALWSTTGALVSLTFLPVDADSMRALPKASLHMWWNAAMPTALYILLGVIIAGGGLADVIAGSLVDLGPVYLFLLPFVAGLSGYITASGTGANAMFGATQVAAAQGLGVSPLWTMGMQNSAAGWAIIAGPARIELAYRMAEVYQRSTTPKPTLSRGALVKVLLPIVLLSLTLWGIVAVIFLPMTG
ncbi:L-lactate permease [Enteractinococcus coprophilus]|uniref:L-lactate permease n=1 Tax=Enteractinococcus coprophilus TaxID=1027633 RepID=A0A543AGQ4_9MICC|nr:L-lactate permease [Enteractinococcus coprophilus]TQL71759.1 lactate permease [Enteractinococcus coprophilus]